MNNHEQPPLVLEFPSTGPRYTLIPHRALQNHLEQIWHAGNTWDLWTLIIHAIASLHDLLYESGLVARSPLLQDLSFLRELAETRAKMHREEQTRIEAKDDRTLTGDRDISNPEESEQNAIITSEKSFRGSIPRALT